MNLCNHSSRRRHRHSSSSIAEASNKNRKCCFCSFSSSLCHVWVIFWFLLIIYNFKSPPYPPTVASSLSRFHSPNPNLTDSTPQNSPSIDNCVGKYIYIHEIPTRFNQDYIRNCKSLNKWHDMCRYFVNEGLGMPIGHPSKLLMNSGWFVTHQFSLEVIFHNRMKRYPCLTKNASMAVAFYVPYYPGLDVSRYLFNSYNISVRDSDSKDLFEMIKETSEWKRMGGKDHFSVAGRITWDFRRVVDEDSGWGNKFMVMMETKNMTILTIESSPWDKNDFAIPYPTYFHPSTDNQVEEWQKRVRNQRRKTLFCFVGAPRPQIDTSIRSEIMEQCRKSRQNCKMIECIDNRENCLKPGNVMKMFLGSIFCLQPPGDSFTRRSTFDSIVSGCIPVFFTPGSAYVQYTWHLPKEFSSYSVLIPEGDVKHKNVSIERFLSEIPKGRVASMREQVIKLIPKVTYGDSRGGSRKTEDAFDVSVRGVIERVQGLKKEMAEGRRESEEFDPESSWKYYTFGTTQPHKWDHYFRRSSFLQRPIDKKG